MGLLFPNSLAVSHIFCQPRKRRSGRWVRISSGKRSTTWSRKERWLLRTVRLIPLMNVDQRGVSHFFHGISQYRRRPLSTNHCRCSMWPEFSPHMSILTMFKRFDLRSDQWRLDVLMIGRCSSNKWSRRWGPVLFWQRFMGSWAMPSSCSYLLSLPFSLYYKYK